MASSIQGYLNDIKNARYGETVRDAIFNAISTCYDDVSNSETIASTAAASAWTAASTAVIRAASAAAAASSAYTAASEAWLAASEAYSQATKAELAALHIASAPALLESVTAAANYAWEQGSYAADAASSATAAASSAATATDRANNAAATAEQKGNTAATQAATAETMALRAQNQADAASAAAAAITNLTVGGTQITADDPTPDSQLVTVSTQNGHKHLQIKLRQGAKGSDFIIKGRYDTIEDLEAATSTINPSLGDMYNVGPLGSLPYSVWRWTAQPTVGDHSGWEEQGPIGSSINNLTTAEINSLLAGTMPTITGDKYINHVGLLQAFTTINSNFAAQSSAIANKVDTDGNKVLSDNNYTTTDMNQVAKIGTLTDLTVSSSARGNLVAAINEVNSNATTVSTNVGSLSSLTTSSKASIVAAINEVKSNATTISTNVGTLSNLNTSSKASIVAAVNEVNTGLTNKILYYSLTTTNTNGSSGTVLTIQAPSSTPNIINANTVVLECIFGSPNTVISDISWTSNTGGGSPGTVTFTGKTVESSPVYVALGTKGN